MNVCTPAVRAPGVSLVGYYTSEIGATQELKYVHAAGSYDGDVPFDEVGRAYS